MTNVAEMEPVEATDAMTLTEMEDLALRHMRENGHVIRHRGQVEVAREMRNIAFSNIADIIYEDTDGVVRMRPLSELPREVTAAIKKIKIKRDRVKGPRMFDEEGNIEPNHVDMTGEVVEIEMWNKDSALDKLQRHYGGYAEDNRQQAEANKGATANLDLLLGAIAGQGLPQLQAADPTPEVEDDPWLEGEEDI